MKYIFKLLLLLLTTTNLWAQTPQSLSYQAVLRDAGGELVNTGTVGMQISILQGDAAAAAVYVETQTPTANANGLVSLDIGAGTGVSGDFTTIDWANGPYFIKIETDLTGGTNYTITGTSQLLSVPYALYAETAGNTTPGPQGPQGEQGPIGATGPEGPQGPAGLNGADGMDGLDGTTGPQGPAGLNGTDGLDGATGPIGPQGSAGTDGEDGVAGADGAMGSEGPQGPVGLNGADGLDGATGPIGPQGPAGTDGEDGVEGADGAMGPEGPQGPAGLNGADGLDGATGPIGPQGSAGTDGEDGVAGADGAMGSEGPQGPAGLNGTDGLDGAMGPKGPAGLDGMDGLDGALGPQGPAGLNGMDGLDGATGPAGPTGPMGPMGPRGNDGAIGETGADGADGSVLNSTTDLAEGTNLYYTETRVSENTAVVANTEKVGYTDALVSANAAVAANTEKVGVTQGTQAGDMQYWDGTAWVVVSTTTNEGATLQMIGGVPTWTGGTIPIPSVTNPTTNKVWMDRNLGAAQVATSSTDADSYGDLYQWGRAADGHQLRTPLSGTTTVQSSLTSPEATFIIGSSNWYNGSDPDDLWKEDGTGVNNPCPSGYRLPTAIEWENEVASWGSGNNNTAGAFASPLKLPAAGYRLYSNGSLGMVGTGGLYWSSTVSSPLSRYLYLSNISANINNFSRASGNAVRCIKH